VCREEVDPTHFFGDIERSRKTQWKTLQLCRQVERAAALALEGAAAEVLLGSVVACVTPAPNASRLAVVVVLAPYRVAEELAEALRVLGEMGPVFRREVAQAIFRKRVPEIVFDVKLSGGASGE
jgi:ribosome-binding factor A